MADRRLTAQNPWGGPTTASNAEFLRGDVGALLDSMSAGGAKVVVMGVPHLRNTAPPSPTPTTTLPAGEATRNLVVAYNAEVAAGVPPAGFAENDAGRIDAWNQVLSSVARGRGARFVDVGARMRAWPKGEFDPQRRAGGVGVTTAGAESIASWLAPRLRTRPPVAPPRADGDGLSANAPLPTPPPVTPRRSVPAGRRATAVVVGDSVAFGLAAGAARWARTQNADLSVVDASKFGCSIARGGSYRYLREVKEFTRDCDWSVSFPGLIATQDPDVVVLSSGIWEVADRLLPGDDRWRHVGMPEFDNYVLREFLSAIDALGAGGAKVLVVTQPHMDPGANQGFTDLPEADPARIDRLNELLARAVSLRPGIATLVDFRSWLSKLPGGELDPTRREDGVHFQTSFQATIGAWLGTPDAPPGEERMIATPLRTPVAADWRPRAVPVELSVMSGQTRRRPALDGLRGLAVVAVVAYHLDVPRWGAVSSASTSSSCSPAT